MDNNNNENTISSTKLQLCNCGHLEDTEGWLKPFDEMDPNHTGFPLHTWTKELRSWVFTFPENRCAKGPPHQVKSSVFTTMCTVFPYKVNMAIMSFYWINLTKYVKYKWWVPKCPSTPSIFQYCKWSKNEAHSMGTCGNNADSLK